MNHKLENISCSGFIKTSLTIPKLQKNTVFSTSQHTADEKWQLFKKPKPSFDAVSACFPGILWEIFEPRPTAAADAAVEHLETVKSDFIHRLLHLFQPGEASRRCVRKCTDLLNMCAHVCSRVRVRPVMRVSPNVTPYAV